MSVLSREEAIEKLSNFIGDNDSDEAIELLEDISDTLTGDGEDWKTRYEENDKEWRRKYKERFLGKTNEDDETVEEDDEEISDVTDYDDLFKEEE